MKMLIDAHTHAYEPKDLDLIRERTSFLDCHLRDNDPHKRCLHHEGSIRSTVREEKKAGIGRFVLLPVSSRPERTRALNQWVARQAEIYPQVIAFGTLLPRSPSLGEELDLVLELGLQGIKVHPFLQRVDILSPPAHYLWSLLAELELPVLLDTMNLEGLVRYKPHLRPLLSLASFFESGPEKIATLAKAHPRLIVIAAHLGSLYGWNNLDCLYPLDNVYFDLSFVSRIVPVSLAMEIIRRKGSDHVLFGTDSPWRCPKEVVAWFEKLPLSGPERERVGWKNLWNLLRAHKDRIRGPLNGYCSQDRGEKPSSP